MGSVLRHWFFGFFYFFAGVCPAAL